MTKKTYIGKLAAVVVVASAGLLAAPSAKADLNINCSAGTYFSGSVDDKNFANNCASVCGGSSQVGSCVYQDNNGACGGPLENDYSCSSGFNRINYNGGSCAQASCFVVQCSGGYYVCNLGCADVNQNVDCNFKGCKGAPEECCFYGNCENPPHTVGAVPEPATIFAGLCLLAPMGIQTFRQLRKRQAGETPGA